MTQNKTNSQIEDEEYLDEKFPKGMSKLRGEAMVLLALARRRGKQEAQKMFLEEIDDRIKLIEEVKKDSDEIEKRICDSKLMELIKLKSKIGGENDTK